MKRTALTLLAALALLGLGGCGGSDSDSGSEDTSFEDALADLPQCSDVWKVGETLDLSTYEGCQDGPDSVVAAVTSGCYDADSKYVGQVATYEDRLWVVQTGTDPKTGKGGTAGEVTDVNPHC
jgi:hypothetical protein